MTETPDLELTPRFWVPLGAVALGLGLAALQRLWHPALWFGLAVGLFGLFLMLQSALLRLTFSSEALLVSRQGTQLRRFPYEAWLGWKLFWPGLPVLFYFRERNSIHLLPMLFDADNLRRQLDERLPRLKQEA